jgi:hypothetical protein
MRAAVLRLDARVELDGSSGEVLRESREQAAEGDEDHAWLLNEREAGTVLLGRLVVSVDAEADGRQEQVSVVNHGVWLERDTVPHVEAQVSQTATKDFSRLTLELRKRAFYVETGALDGMYVHVELGAALRRALGAGSDELDHAT